jgi:hypothetical protein
MSVDESDLTWKINSIREEIGLDWKKLASKDLPAEQRKLIMEHLHMCNSSLKTFKDLAEKNRSGGRESKSENNSTQGNLFQTVSAPLADFDQ